MATVTVIRSIRAPAAAVLDAVADPRQFARAISGVTRLDFLSDATAGAGTRFRQSRTMNGKEMTMEFAVTEYVRDERVRIVNATGGTVWDSVYTIAPSNASTTLTLRMEARSRSLLTRVLLPVICLLVLRALARDIDAVKAWCERSSGSATRSGARAQFLAATDPRSRPDRNSVSALLELRRNAEIPADRSTRAGGRPEVPCRRLS